MRNRLLPLLLLALSAAAILFFYRVDSVAEEKSSTVRRTEWEHKVVVLTPNDLAKLVDDNPDLTVDENDPIEAISKLGEAYGKVVEKHLNEYGAAGWQLAAAGDGWMVLKRPVVK